jgi:hypothetical protein
MLRLLPLTSLLIATLFSGCHSAPEPPDEPPHAEDGPPARAVLSLDLPDDIDLGIRRSGHWRFADQLPLDREAAYTDYIRNAPGGRFGTESLTSDTAQLIAERAQDWWVVGLSFDALRPAQYEHDRWYSDPSLPPLEYVRAFLASPDFVTWANELGMHLHLPLDRPEDDLFEHVYIDRANASGPLLLHPSIRSLIVDLADLDQIDANGLIEQLPTLTKLERVKVVTRDVEQAIRFFAALPKRNLRTINFTGDPRPVASSIGSFPRLERLYIRYEPTDEVRAAARESRIPTPLAGLSASESLEALRISGHPRRDEFLYGEGAVDEIVGVETLRVLELPDAGLTDEHVRRLATLPDLEALDVSYNHGVSATTLFGTGYTDIPGRLTDEAVVTLARSKSLRRLDIVGNRLTARAHETFAGWETLEELSIEDPLESSPEWLATMPNLKRLTLSSAERGQRFTAAHLSIIAESSSLEYININQGLTVEFIHAAGQMEQLRVLHGTWTRIDTPTHLHEAAPEHLFLSYR